MSASRVWHDAATQDAVAMAHSRWHFSNRNPTFRTFAGQRSDGSVLWHLAMSVSSSDERSGSLEIVGSVRGMVRMGGFLLPMCRWWWSQALYLLLHPQVTFADLIWLAQNSQMFGIEHTTNPWEMMTRGDAIPHIQQGLLYVPLKMGNFKHMFMFRTLFSLWPNVQLFHCLSSTMFIFYTLFSVLFLVSSRQGET